MQRVLKVVRIVLWLCCIGVLARLLWFAVIDALASEWFAVPATAAFALLMLLAGPPYLTSLQRGGETRFAFFRWLALLGAALVAVGVLFLGFVKTKFAAALPADMRAVTEYDPTVATRVYSADGEHICTFSRTYRVRVPIADVPLRLRQAILAAEDAKFYEHHGIDPLAMLRALIANQRSGRTAQGGSTITQQVTKMLTGNDERTYKRKAQEAFMAVEMERRLTKDQIFEVYLNNPFFGREAYGVQAAAEVYFGKSVKDLTLAEAAMLAGLPQAPSRHSPLGKDPASMRNRTRYVLDRMQKLGFISEAEHRNALAEEFVFIAFKNPLNHTAAPYVCEDTRKELKRVYGERAIYEQGLTVQTTIDMRMQRPAEAAVRWGLRDLERRLGFNGPAAFNDTKTPCDEEENGSVEDYGEYASRVVAVGKRPEVCVQGNRFPVHPDDVQRIAAWEAKSKLKLRVGDVLPVAVITVQPEAKSRKARQPDPIRYAISARRTGGPGKPDTLQGTFLLFDARTGELRVMIGGYDYVEDQVNFATMERRQAGSSIKAAVYATALEGTDEVAPITVDMKVLDTPRSYVSGGRPWSPKNYENKFKGWVPVPSALAQSLNSVSVDFTAKYGAINVVRMLRRLGVSSPLVPVLPISVGAADITPWEMATMYATIAAGGKALPRHPGAGVAGVFITKVTAANGRVLPEFSPPPPREEWPQAIAPAVAYELTYLLQKVVEDGTGRRLQELGRPAGGKTGTTNESREVWFSGFTSDYVFSTAVFRKKPSPIAKKATGGSVALPICLAAVKAAYPANLPVTDFPVPDDVVLLPNQSGELIPYQRGRVPQRFLVPEGGANGFLATSPF